MPFLRHIGKHGDRKVAVIFREIPGEEHMCLVVYTEILNRHLHDSLMRCLESDVGQNTEILAEALNRSFTQDGQPILGVLHREGILKKVQTDAVLMTPQPQTHIKLSELNKLLDEMKKGEDAVKRLSEMDKSRGMQDPAEVARRMRTQPQPQSQQQTVTNTSRSQEIYAPTDMSDAAIAWRMRQQAEKMAAEGRGLLAESDRLLKEAAQMSGTPLPIATPTTVKVKRKTKVDPVTQQADTMSAVLVEITSPSEVTPTPAKRGRPAKKPA